MSNKHYNLYNKIKEKQKNIGYGVRNAAEQHVQAQRKKKAEPKRDVRRRKSTPRPNATYKKSKGHKYAI